MIANQIEDGQVSGQVKAQPNNEKVDDEKEEVEVEEQDTEEDANDEKTWWTGDQTHEAKVHVFEMKSIERRKGQINERPDQTEKEVVQELVEEEEVGQEGGNDE